MKRTPVSMNEALFPAELRPFLSGAAVFDSSCSADSRVYFIDKEAGFYLKTAPVGLLKTEAEMTGFFHRKGLAPEVLLYTQTQADWLLTRRVPGEDCIHRPYLADPRRLCDTLARLLRQLHETDSTGCPVQNRTADYIAVAAKNYRLGKWHPSRLPAGHQVRSAADAWAMVQEFSGALKDDVLIHGDYCLPNIMLDNWKFSGFLDLGGSGLGDRHMDLYWGLWSLNHNLETDAYRERFLDVYGRDGFDSEILQAIGAFEAFG